MPAEFLSDADFDGTYVAVLTKVPKLFDSVERIIRYTGKFKE